MVTVSISSSSVVVVIILSEVRILLSTSLFKSFPTDSTFELNFYPFFKQRIPSPMTHCYFPFHFYRMSIQWVQWLNPRYVREPIPTLRILLIEDSLEHLPLPIFPF